MLDSTWLAAYCVDACQRNGLTVVGQLFHTFKDADESPAGVTGAVILAESHLALHTWPEIRSVTLDVYVCNFSGDNSDAAEALFGELINTFAPQHIERKRVNRGQLNQAT